MRLALYFKALAVWCAFLLVALAGRAIREAVLLPALGEHRAHQVATLIVAVLVLVLVDLFARVVALSARDAVRIGLLWFGLSLWFEFIVTHYFLGAPWDLVLADYNLAQGRLLLLVLLTELLGPFAIVALRHRQ